MQSMVLICGNQLHKKRVERECVGDSLTSSSVKLSISLKYETHDTSTSLFSLSEQEFLMVMY